MDNVSSNVVSLEQARLARTKDLLALYSDKGDTLILETRKGLVRAEKIVCREFAVETLNSFGDYFILRYSDIVGIRPVGAVQASTVTSRAMSFFAASASQAATSSGIGLSCNVSRLAPIQECRKDFARSLITLADDHEGDEHRENRDCD